MRIILIGAPGAGKGTQANLISKYFQISHLSTGDMFRANISDKTHLGLIAETYIKKGLLVPDDVTISLVKNYMKEKLIVSDFLLDGFPRNLYQAKELDIYLNKQNSNIDKVIFINVPIAKLINRLSSRRICEKCGSIHQVTSNSLSTNNKCDQCGGLLIQREDDTESVVTERLRVYNNSIKPMLDYYAGQGILCRVDGSSSIQNVFSSICSMLTEEEHAYETSKIIV